MADLLNLIDLLLSDSEYCNLTNNINECLEDPKGHYINHGLETCEPLNKYFQEHQELLYSIGSDGKNECILQESYKNGLSVRDIEFIDNLLEINAQIIDHNINHLKQISPEKLENIIIQYYKNKYFQVLKEEITEELSSINDFKYSDELLKVYQKDLRRTGIDSYKECIIKLPKY